MRGSTARNPGRVALIRSAWAALSVLVAGCVAPGVDEALQHEEPGVDLASQAPMLVGRVSRELVEGTEEPALRVRLDGRQRDVAIGDALTFAMRGLPTGDFTLEVEAHGVRGRLPLADVAAAEVIEVFVNRAGGGLEIRVVRRDRAVLPPVELLPLSDDAVEIRANGVVVHLEPGIYRGDFIIRGSYVTLVGASHGTCDPDGRTSLAGDVAVEGNAARFVNVSVRGAVEVAGSAATFFDECR